MKMLVLYREKSEERRKVEEFVRDFTTRNREIRVETLDLNTREGAAMANLYDMMQQPVILVTRDDGSLVSSWQGAQLPRIDEVAAYARG